METNQVQQRFRASSRFSPTKISNMELEEDKDTESLLPKAAVVSDGHDKPSPVKYCGGRIQAEKVGNMIILFPDRFRAGKTRKN